MIVLAFLAQVLRIAVPYFLAAAGGVISERVGIIALSLEGFMLTGAFCTALGSYYTGSPWIGLLCGALGGMLAALVLAVTYVGGELAQTAIGLPQAATGMFQALLLFFLLASDVLIRFRIVLGRPVGARAA